MALRVLSDIAAGDGAVVLARFADAVGGVKDFMAKEK